MLLDHLAADFPFGVARGAQVDVPLAAQQVGALLGRELGAPFRGAEHRAAQRHDGRGENAITVVPGANMGLAVEQVEAAAPLFPGVKVLLAQLEHPFPATLKAVELARRAGALAILDPAPVPSFPFEADTIRMFDALTPNEIETEALTGIAPVDVEAAAAAAGRLRKTGLPLALIKMGARGVYVDSAAFRGHVPPFAVTAVDTVAAGDCFAAGLAVALAEGMTVEAAIRFAAACGALACTREGSSEAAPTRAEVEALLARG